GFRNASFDVDIKLGDHVRITAEPGQFIANAVLTNMEANIPGVGVDGTLVEQANFPSIEVREWGYSFVHHGIYFVADEGRFGAKLGSGTFSYKGHTYA